jgi:hypothetical protein
MTTTSLTLKNVSGSFAAASARFVSGPTATIVIVSGSLSLSNSSICSCAGFSEGVNSECRSLTACSSAASSSDRFSGSGRKSDFHVSAGVRCGCWRAVSQFTCRRRRTHAVVNSTQTIHSVYYVLVSSRHPSALVVQLTEKVRHHHVLCQRLCSTHRHCAHRQSIHNAKRISSTLPIGFRASSVSKPAGRPFALRHSRSFSM